MSHPSPGFTLFAAIKDPEAEEGLILRAFWCGKLLEGKRITEGKMLKRGLVESLHQEL
jgi:hypothetical protein